MNSPGRKDLRKKMLISSVILQKENTVEEVGGFGNWGKSDVV